RTANRPVFLQMVALAKQNPPPFEAILVWKFSRFARNREDSILYKSLLRRHGVRVLSINEPLENSPTGRLMEGVIESMDEVYSANLAQDVTGGMREAASRGFWVGSVAPYGYLRVKVNDGHKERTKLEIDPNTAWVVQKVFDLASNGLGAKEIAKTLNQKGCRSARGGRWGRGQVHKILSNQVYIGTLLWGVTGKYHRENVLPPVRVENAFPSLVDLDTFRQVHAMLKARSPQVEPPRQAGSPHLLSGLLRCGGCGAKMFAHKARSHGKSYLY
ncbi:MAG: recombinase family protein, partial [Chloroflexi bacterium]|nr:recombinase family protein [Chloroflexota bacterium]